MTYRAAYWVSDDRQGEVLLTGPDHATLSDDRLLDVARAGMVEAGITEADGGAIEVGLWEDGGYTPPAPLTPMEQRSIRWVEENYDTPRVDTSEHGYECYCHDCRR